MLRKGLRIAEKTSNAESLYGMPVLASRPLEAVSRLAGPEPGLALVPK